MAKPLTKHLNCFTAISVEGVTYTAKQFFNGVNIYADGTRIPNQCTIKCNMRSSIRGLMHLGGSRIGVVMNTRVFIYDISTSRAYGVCADTMYMHDIFIVNDYVMLVTKDDEGLYNYHMAIPYLTLEIAPKGKRILKGVSFKSDELLLTKASEAQARISNLSYTLPYRLK